MSTDAVALRRRSRGVPYAAAARPKLLWCAALLAVGLYLAIYLWLAPKISWAAPDFACFYRAGRMVLSGAGAQIYDLAAEGRFDALLAPEVLRPGQHFTSLPFVFAPPSLLLLAPLAALPYTAARALCFAISAGAMLALPLVLRRALHLGDTATALALLLPPLSIPVLIAIVHGQTSPVVALLFALAFLALERRNDTLAGGLLAFAAWKPQFVLPALVALLAARRWKALAGFAGSSVALLTASMAQLGWRTVLVAYPQSLLEFTRLPEAKFGEHIDQMPNLRALSAAVFGPGLPARVATVATSLVLLGLLAWIFRPSCRASLRLKFALLLIVTVLVSYHCYAHDATLLGPAALLLAGTTNGHGLTWSRIPAWIVVAEIFVAGYFWPHSQAMRWMAVLMVALAALLIAEMTITIWPSGGLRVAHAFRRASRTHGQSSGFSR